MAAGTSCSSRTIPTAAPTSTPATPTPRPWCSWPSTPPARTAGIAPRSPGCTPSRTADGGFPYQAGAGTDPDSTALVLQALIATGQNPVAPAWAPGGNSPLAELIATQDGGGGFTFPGNSGPDPFTTAQVPPALERAPYPLTCGPAPCYTTGATGGVRVSTLAPPRIPVGIADSKHGRRVTRRLLRVAFAVPLLAIGLGTASAAARVGPTTPLCAQAASTHHAGIVVEHGNGHGDPPLRRLRHRDHHGARRAPDERDRVRDPDIWRPRRRGLPDRQRARRATPSACRPRARTGCSSSRAGGGAWANSSQGRVERDGQRWRRRRLPL